MFFEKIIQMLYPYHCIFCGKSTKNDSYTCENCLTILQYYRVHQLPNNSERFYYDKAWAVFVYDGWIKAIVLKYKFHGQRFLSHFFSYQLFQKIMKTGIQFDVIVPVPISFSRWLQRGYNQSAEIAYQISRKLHLAYDKSILVKKRDNVQQSSLQYHERMKNVKNVYQVKNPKKIQKKTVLLIDDIYTTGATVNECARILKQSGAAQVIVLTIAYAKKDGKD